MWTFLGDLPVAGTGARVVLGTVHIPTLPTIILSLSPHVLEETGSLQMRFTGRWCLCMGQWKYRDGYEKKRLTDSHQDKVMWLFRLADWNLLPPLSISILGLESISPTVSFFFFPLPLQASKPLLLFSFFIFPVLWSLLPGVFQLPGVRRIDESDILS